MAWCIKPKIRVFFPGLLRFLSKTCWRYISCRKVSLLLNIMEAHCSCLVAHKVLKHYIWKIQLQYFYKKCYLDKKKKTAHKPWCRQFHGGTKLHQPHMSLCRRKHQAPSHQWLNVTEKIVPMTSCLQQALLFFRVFLSNCIMMCGKGQNCWVFIFIFEKHKEMVISFHYIQERTSISTADVSKGATHIMDKIK